MVHEGLLCLSTDQICWQKVVMIMSRSNWVNMALVLSYRGYPFALLVLLFLSSDPFNGIHCSRNRQQISANKVAVINHEHCQSCPIRVSSLKDVHAYSELKYDPRASLPSSCPPWSPPSQPCQTWQQLFQMSWEAWWILLDSWENWCNEEVIIL